MFELCIITHESSCIFCLIRIDLLTDEFMFVAAGFFRKSIGAHRALEFRPGGVVFWRAIYDPVVVSIINIGKSLVTYRTFVLHTPRVIKGRTCRNPVLSARIFAAEYLGATAALEFLIRCMDGSLVSCEATGCFAFEIAFEAIVVELVAHIFEILQVHVVYVILKFAG